MSSIRAPSCFYVPQRHRQFFKNQLSELNAYDAVIKEMKEECGYNGNEDDEDYDTRIFSSMDSSFNCFPYTSNASNSTSTFNPSDYDIHWPDEGHLPSKYRTRRHEAEENRRRQQGNDNHEEESKRNNKPRKIYHYTVFH